MEVEDSTSDCESSDEYDDPRQSAAALCLSLRFAHDPNTQKDGNDDDQYLGPEYTHQCFDREAIPGYQPFEEDAQHRMIQIAALEHKNLAGYITSPPPPPKHGSHAHFETAQEYLRVKIDVAPSCTVCKVSIRRESKQDSLSPATVDKENRSKRRRLENDPSPKSAVRFKEDEDTKSEKQSSGNAEKSSKMPLDQVLDCLRRMLPDVVPETESVHDRYLAKPQGVEVHQYCRDDSHFCVCLANGEDVASYHNAVQRLALGWIETADGIDLTYQPHGGQYWQIAYLFQKHAPDKYSLAGYMTLWNVTSILFQPGTHGGRILRITQALLLPHHQRRGHGQELLRVVYNYAHGKYDEKFSRSAPVKEPVVQVNVEDPAPRFTALRDLVDYQLFLEHDQWRSMLATAISVDYAPLAEREYKDIAKQAKITPRQVQIVHELLFLRQLVLQHLTLNADVEKSFRLGVKERLYQENKVAVTSLSSKDLMQAELSNLYDEQRSHYNRLLAKVHGYA